MFFNSKIHEIFNEETSDFLSPIDQEKANALVKGECSEFQKQQQIFHIIPKDKLNEAADFFIADPLKLAKQYNKNYDAILMDNLSSWEQYPVRNNSIICTANKDKLTKNGVIYVAVPFNKTKLGVCPKESAKESFKNVSINLGIKFEYFNPSLNILLNIFNNPQGAYDQTTKKLTLSGEKWYDKDYNSFKAAVSKVDEMFISEEGQKIVREVINDPYNKETHKNVISLINYLNAKKSSLTQVLETLFDPAKNGFKFIPFKTFTVGDMKNNEVWFNNKCLLAKETVFEYLSFPIPK
jgi:hypothetical protein